MLNRKFCVFKWTLEIQNIYNISAINLFFDLDAEFRFEFRNEFAGPRYNVRWIPA